MATVPFDFFWNNYGQFRLQSSQSTKNTPNSSTNGSFENLTAKQESEKTKLETKVLFDDKFKCMIPKLCQCPHFTSSSSSISSPSSSSFFNNSSSFFSNSSSSLAAFSNVALSPNSSTDKLTPLINIPVQDNILNAFKLPPISEMSSQESPIICDCHHDSTNTNANNSSDPTNISTCVMDNLLLFPNSGSNLNLFSSTGSLNLNSLLCNTSNNNTNTNNNNVPSSPSINSTLDFLNSSSSNLKLDFNVPFLPSYISPSSSSTTSTPTPTSTSTTTIPTPTSTPTPIASTPVQTLTPTQTTTPLTQANYQTSMQPPLLPSTLSSASVSNSPLSISSLSLPTTSVTPMTTVVTNPMSFTTSSFLPPQRSLSSDADTSNINMNKVEKSRKVQKREHTESYRRKNYETVNLINSITQLGNNITKTADAINVNSAQSHVDSNTTPQQEKVSSEPVKRAKNNSSDQEKKKKARYKWSVELHSEFIKAYNELSQRGYPTPKQIMTKMEQNGAGHLMKELTRIHVNTHLQKYELNILKNINNPDNSKTNKNASKFTNLCISRNKINRMNDISTVRPS